MTVNTGDILVATAKAEFNGIDDMLNVYQFEMLTATPLTDQEAVGDIIEILESLYTLINGILSVLYLYRDITITNKTQNLLLGTFGWPTLVAGLATGDTTPPGVAGVISFSTSQPRRQLRKYIGGLSAASIEGAGVIEPVTLTNLSNFGTFLLATLVGNVGTWAYTHENVLLTPERIFPVSTLITNIPGYQRRRKQGRGS